MMKKAVVLLLLLAVCGGFVFAEGQAEYHARDITNVVVWGAGGGTDTCNRVVSAEMAKILGVNINVINKTGGVAGSVGLLYGYAQDHDGYTVTGLSESNVTAAVMGGWDKKFDVWYPFIVGGSPDLVSVTPDSPYTTLADLVQAAKADPNAIRAGASGAGSIHHLNLLALEKGTGAKFNFIPYDGSAPAQNAAMTGEISMVVTSLAEQQQLIRSGKLRPLAMLIKNKFEVAGFGTIPSAFDSFSSLNEYLPISQAIGFALPADAPQVAKDVLGDAFEKALKTDKVQKWAKDNYYLLSGAYGDDASKIFSSLESNFAWTLWDLGAVKVAPSELGIPKP